MLGYMADAEDGLRFGVVIPEDTADNSAGVEGGGFGPGGLSDGTGGSVVDKFGAALGSTEARDADDGSLW
jgi:hypothetical protein